MLLGNGSQDGQSEVGGGGDPPAVRPEDLGIGLLFEGVRDAVIAVDAESGRVVLWNRAAEEIFGYPRSEVLGLDVEVIIPERLKERHRAGMARFRETGHGAHIDAGELLHLPALRKGGEEIQVEMSLTPVFPTEGAAAGRRFALAIARDVTGRAEAQRRLEESEERFRLVARATNEVI